MKIIFIRHAESYANSIKKYNNIDYNKRKIINYSTLENEKIKSIENRLFDTFLTEEGIVNCIKNIKNNNNKITIITSPLKRSLMTTFFLYYNNFIDNGRNIEIFISNNLKEIF
jgi:broad specificity phosphatase PhoE